MSFKNPKEIFVLLLSDVRRATERSIKFFNEIIPLVQDTDIKEALEARVFVSGNMLASLDQCFTLIGEQPVQLTGRLQETFVENFLEVLPEIQSPVAKHLFVLSKINHLVHMRIGELVALTAAAAMTGHFAVGVLLESVLADYLAFVERTKRLIRNVIETRVAEKKAAAA